MIMKSLGIACCLLAVDFLVDLFDQLEILANFLSFK